MDAKIRNRRRVRFFLQCWRIRLTTIGLLLMFATTALKVQAGFRYATFKDIFSSPTNKPETTVSPPKEEVPLPSSSSSANQLQTTAPPPEAEASMAAATLPAPTLQASKPKKNEVSISGDYMFGQGDVTLPIGYSLIKALKGSGASLKPSVIKPSRDSEYFGGTVSYSYGQAWYFDLSYAHGNSSGNQTLDYQSLGTGSGSFSLDDDWYQAYVRYTFPQLRGKRLSAYLRAGVTYIEATLDDASRLASGLGLYKQHDESTEIRGNLGVGLGYNVYSSRRFRFGLEVDGEGFYGNRSQDSRETLENDYGLTPVTASIDNTIYGGIGRAVMHFEYKFGRTGLFRTFLDAGGEVFYTEIDYPSAGTFNEELWGPYVKLGLRYSF
jgi:hypothetical protein